MDIEKIKERLAAVRPDSPDFEDPEVAELLALVEEDPELDEWFRQHQAFDRAFAEKLAEIEPPARLQEQILKATGKSLAPEPDSQPEAPGDAAPDQPHAKETAVAEEKGTAIPFQPREKRAWWQNPGVISMAAAFVLLGAFTLMLFDPTPVSADTSMDAFLNHIHNRHVSQQPVEFQSADMNQIAAHLREKGAPIPDELPPDVDVLPEIGCSVFRWGGELISVIRMEAEPAVDLYVVQRGLFPKLADQPQPHTVELNQITVLAWSEGDVHYFLVHTGVLEKLKDLL